jgi:hypothetical protein
MKEPKFEDFIGRCEAAIVPRASIMADLVNPITSSQFYYEYADEIIEKMKDAVINKKNFDDLIDEISTKASEKPSFDFEDRLLDINERTKLAAPSDPIALKAWRKENYWSKHVKNVVNEIEEQAKKNFETEKERYKLYTEGDDTMKDLIDLGFF